jgi:hypothetical protein
MLYFFDRVSIGVDHTILYSCSRVIVSIMQFLGAKDSEPRQQRSRSELTQSSQLIAGRPHLAHLGLFYVDDVEKVDGSRVFVKQRN